MTDQPQEPIRGDNRRHYAAERRQGPGGDLPVVHAGAAHAPSGIPLGTWCTGSRSCLLTATSAMHKGMPCNMQVSFEDQSAVPDWQTVSLLTVGLSLACATVWSNRAAAEAQLPTLSGKLCAEAAQASVRHAGWHCLRRAASCTGRGRGTQHGPAVFPHGVCRVYEAAGKLVSLVNALPQHSADCAANCTSANNHSCLRAFVGR